MEHQISVSRLRRAKAENRNNFILIMPKRAILDKVRDTK